MHLDGNINIAITYSPRARRVSRASCGSHPARVMHENDFFAMQIPLHFPAQACTPRLPPNLGGSLGEGESSSRPRPRQGLPQLPEPCKNTAPEKQVLKRNSVIDLLSAGTLGRSRFSGSLLIQKYIYFYIHL